VLQNQFMIRSMTVTDEYYYWNHTSGFI